MCSPSQLAFPVGTASPLCLCLLPVLCRPCQWLHSSLVSMLSPVGCCFVNQQKQSTVFAFPVLTALTWLSVFLHTCYLSFLESLFSCSAAPFFPNPYLFAECLFPRFFSSEHCFAWNFCFMYILFLGSIAY